MSPLDPRTVADVRVGAPMRDGAVTPLPGDYLGPVNAGKAGEAGNPHGASVWNPEIHGSQGVRPVRPGPVSSDPAVQSTDETAHATAQTFSG